MNIQIGETIPEGQLIECDEFDPESGCPINPRAFEVLTEAKGVKDGKKKCIVLFGVPGAFTPTCSQKHLPGFLSHYASLKAHGVDEIWCLAVNDHFVMAAWGRELGATGKIRMLADGSADYARKLGLDRDLSKNGMGTRLKRFAMILHDGVISYLGVEEPGKFEASSAETVLANLD